MESAVGSLARASRDADVDAPRRHLGVFLVAHEVELGRPDIGVPGELAHLGLAGGLPGEWSSDAPSELRQQLASTPISAAKKSMTVLPLSEDSRILENHAQSSQPWDWWAFPIQRGFAKDRVMRAFVEPNHNPVALDLHNSSGRHKSLEHLLRFGRRMTRQLRCQPAIAPVRDHRQRHIEVHIEAGLFRY